MIGPGFRASARGGGEGRGFSPWPATITPTHSNTKILDDTTILHLFGRFW